MSNSIAAAAACPFSIETEEETDSGALLAQADEMVEANKEKVFDDQLRHDAQL